MSEELENQEAEEHYIPYICPRCEKIVLRDSVKLERGEFWICPDCKTRLWEVCNTIFCHRNNQHPCLYRIGRFNKEINIYKECTMWDGECIEVAAAKAKLLKHRATLEYQLTQDVIEPSRYFHDRDLLKAGGVENFGQLMQMTEKEILKIKGIGKAGIRDIKKEFLSKGIIWPMER